MRPTHFTPQGPFTFSQKRMNYPECDRSGKSHAQSVLLSPIRVSHAIARSNISLPSTDSCDAETPQDAFPLFSYAAKQRRRTRFVATGRANAHIQRGMPSDGFSANAGIGVVPDDFGPKPTAYVTPSPKLHPPPVSKNGSFAVSHAPLFNPPPRSRKRRKIRAFARSTLKGYQQNFGNIDIQNPESDPEAINWDLMNLDQNAGTVNSSNRGCTFNPTSFSTVSSDCAHGAANQEKHFPLPLYLSLGQNR